MYRILGLFSSLTWKLSRQRVNAIPAWAWVAILSGAVGVLSFVGVMIALANPNPLEVSIEALAQDAPERAWVRVTGFPIYSLTIEESEEDGGNVTAWYYSLRDMTTGAYLLVQSKTDPTLRPAEQITIEGMLRSTPGDMREIILRNMSAGYRTCATHYLAPDQRPVPLWISATGLGVCSLITLLVFGGRMHRFTTFKRGALTEMGATVPAPTPEQPLPCLATGDFYPVGGSGKIFGRQIAGGLVPGEDEAGNPCGHSVVCNAKGGGGVQTLHIPIPEGVSCQTGHVYAGLTTLSALHLTGQGINAYLAFETPGHALAAQRAIAQT